MNVMTQKPLIPIGTPTPNLVPRLPFLTALPYLSLSVQYGVKMTSYVAF